MRTTFLVLKTILLVLLLAGASLAQPDRLQGRWEGTTKSVQGERPATVILKKEVDGYSGTITGAQGTTPLKEIKVDGDAVTAISEVDSPQAGRLSFHYKLALQGENLKGTGVVEIAGQVYDFAIDLKRISTSTALTQQEERRTRPTVPQPQQKRSLDYFIGQWDFKWVGRESALGAGGRRDGMTTFKLTPDSKTIESHTEGKSDDGVYQESAVISFDEATKILSFSERRQGVQVISRGGWISPLAIRFTVDPIKIKNRTLQLKRTLTVISAYSFTVIEELSEDGGPFVRLGQAIFSKANAATTTQ